MHIDLVIAKVVTLALGVLIASQAYRGYRDHGQEPMLYLSAGFLLVSVGAVIEGVLFDVVGLELLVAGTIQTSVLAVGLLVILYSLSGYADGVTHRGAD
jgi:hypothetical protein